jgi:hypothetical protein
MSELKAALRPYSLEATRRSDSNSGVRCVTIDVGRDQSGNPVPSLELLRAEVDRYLFNDRGRGISARKLFIVGEWNLGPPKTDPVSAMPDERTHSEVSYNMIALPSVSLSGPTDELPICGPQPQYLRSMVRAKTDAHRSCERLPLPTSGRKALR